MRRLRRSIGIGAALSFLLLGAPLEAAGDSHEDSPATGQADEHRADPAEQRARAKPVEPRGNPASPAAMRAGRLSCGDVITKTTTLTVDIGPCPGDGIIIGADNIMLNLNGHTISGTPGPGDGNAAGIRVPFRTGVRITGQPGNSGRTGTVTGFDAGVFIDGGSGNTVENLAVIENIGPGPDMGGGEEELPPLLPPGGGFPPPPPPSNDAVLSDGIALFHSASNRLINNLVLRNGPYDGIGVLGLDSNDNLIQGNTVEESVGIEGGTSMGGEGTGIIIHNFLDEVGSPRRGESIQNNNVLNNIVRRNDNSGISNISNVEGRIEGNIVEDNGQRGEQCTSNFGVFRCDPVAFPSNGIGVSRGLGATEFTRVLVQGNLVRGNTGNGIAVGSPGFRGNARQNRIIGNTAVGNGGTSAHNNANDRFDLRDFSDNGSLMDFQYTCDENIWKVNVFETAFPDCIYEQHGLTPPQREEPTPIGGGELTPIGGGGELTLIQP